MLPSSFADKVHISFVPGKSSGLASSTKRTSSLLRPTSPRSPVASASAFESVEGSDDEDNLTENAKLDTTYIHTNGNAVSLCRTYETPFFISLRVNSVFPTLLRNNVTISDIAYLVIL